MRFFRVLILMMVVFATRVLVASYDQIPEKAFTFIYENDVWGGGSGEGSKIEYCGEYISFLEKFLSDNNITTVVDLGCGDWQFSRYIDWSNTNYIGLDVVDSVIKNNKTNFEKENVRFKKISGFLDVDIVADLLICKDVLQHCNLKDVCRFIRVMKKYKYIIVTNDVPAIGLFFQNVDIQTGDYHYRDLEMPPFNLHPWYSIHMQIGSQMKKISIYKN